MAVSEKYTITFPEKVLSKGGDTIQVIITLFNDDGVNTPVDAREYNMKILSYGELSWEWDLDDPFLVPSGLTLLVSDPEEFISDFLFESPPDPTVEERSYQMEVEYLYNGSTIWKGLSTEDGVEYNVGDKALMIEVVTPFEKINELKLFDASNSPINPLGWGSYWVNVQTMLDDIFQLINPSITVDIDHSWIWRDTNPAPDVDYTLDQLYMNVTSWFQNHGYQQASTVGDFLRQIAFEFFCFTGMSTWDTAFFSMVIDFLKVPTTTDIDGIVKNWVKGFGYSQLKYLELNAYNPNLNVVDTPTSKWYRGTFANSGIDSASIVVDKLTEYLNTGLNASSLRGVAGSSTTSIDFCVARINAWGTGSSSNKQAYTLIETMWNTRSLIQMARRDQFTFEGLDYTFPFAFKFGDEVFQSTKMIKKFGQNETYIEAFVWPVDPLA